MIGSADPVTALGARALSAAIHDRTLSCVEVMTAYLDRIDAVNGRVNAIVSLRPCERLLSEAAAADAELARGHSRGWLHGIPQAPKDLTATAGIPTTMGSPALARSVPLQHSILVERTVAAGAILIGKTNVPEFGLGSHTFNPLFGPTRNPFDPDRSAGGSSGGAAAALATRMLPVADGSDMMGSLRNPAGWNNVYGFRPSVGRVPSGPAPELFLQQLSTEGPMARSVVDLAMLLSTQTGFDARMPLSLEGSGGQFMPPFVPEVAGIRVGWLGDLEGHLAMEAGVLETCEAALGLLEAIGCRVEPVRIDFDLHALWWAWTTLRSFLVAGSLGAVHDAPGSSLKAEAVWEIERGRALGAMDVFRASAVRSAWYRTILDLHAQWDILVLPTAQVFSFDVRARWPQEIAGRAMDSYHRWMEVVVPASMAGTPTLAVPAGFGPGGLPIGVQLMGPPRADLAVLKLGCAYDEAQPWTGAGDGGQ